MELIFLSSLKQKATIEKDCISCNRCYNSCSMLQELGKGFLNILQKDSLKKGRNKCTLCGLCNEVCPQNLDIVGYYSELKKEGRKPMLTRYARFIHRKRLEQTNE